MFEGISHLGLLVCMMGVIVLNLGSDLSIRERFIVLFFKVLLSFSSTLPICSGFPGLLLCV